MARDLTEMYVVDLTTGCWNWIKGCSQAGYGAVHIGDITYRAHRLSFIQTKGNIPEGFDLHHKCENKKCINPDHLELLKHSKHRSLHGKVKFCKRGHEFTPENTRHLASGGRRACKQCDNDRAKKQRELKKKTAEVDGLRKVQNV